jgi:hypothetical protein
MTLEEAVVAKLHQLPEHERKRLLVLINEWVERRIVEGGEDAQRAVTAVQSTWATAMLDQETLRWVAEDKELEYDVS